MIASPRIEPVLSQVVLARMVVADFFWSRLHEWGARCIFG
jgi:hypothetical protein